MLDIKRYYYNVNFTKAMFDEFIVIEKESLNFALMERLNVFVFEVLKKYSNILGCEKVVLPIGFLPSAILGNWYLDEFDKKISNEINPTYYGRYVDDIIIVDKIEKNSKISKLLESEETSEETIISEYLINDKKLPLKYEKNVKKIYLKINRAKKITKNKVVGKIIKRYESKPIENTEYTINFEKNSTIQKSSLNIQKSKVKIIYIESSSPRVIIDKFREEIRKNSSEFRLLPDATEVFLEKYTDIYKMENSDSVNKLRGIESIQLDKYALAKFIGKQVTIAKYIEDDRENLFYDDLEKIFDNKTIIENRLTWEQILTLCILNNKMNKLKKIFNKILSAILEIDVDEITIFGDIKLSSAKFLFACLMRSSAIVKNKEMDKYIIEVFTNLKEKFNCDFEDIRLKYINTCVISRIYIDTIPKSLDIKNNEEYNLSSLETSIKLTEGELYKEYEFYPYIVTKQDINKILLYKSFKDHSILFEGIEPNKQLSSLIESIYFKINYGYENLEGKIKSKIFYEDKKRELYFNAIEINSSIEPKDKTLKVALATATLKHNDFIGVLEDTSNRTLTRYNDIVDIINEAVRNDVQLLILPESYIPFEWIPLLEREVKKNNMAIITGIEHIKYNETIHNITLSLFPYEHEKYNMVYSNYRTKVHYSPGEKRIIEGYGYKYCEGKEYNMFIWNNIWIPVYCCFEISSINDRGIFYNYADLIVVTEWNSDINYFNNIVESLCRDMNCFCAQVNSAQYGDSCLLKPAKSESKTILRTKGGKNNTILVDEIGIEQLRKFQLKKYELQKDDKTFKPTPPTFNREIIRKKLKGSMFSEFRDDIK